MKIRRNLSIKLLLTFVTLTASIAKAQYHFLDERTHYDCVTAQIENEKLSKEIQSCNARLEKATAKLPSLAEEPLTKTYVYFAPQVVCPVDQSNFTYFLKSELNDRTDFVVLQSLTDNVPTDIKESLTLFVTLDIGSFNYEGLNKCGEITSGRCVLTRIASGKTRESLEDVSREDMNAAKHFYLHDPLDFLTPNYRDFISEVHPDYLELNEESLEILKTILDGKYPSEAPYGWRKRPSA